MRDSHRTRTAIRAAARNLFATHGFAATTVRAIAAEAGCTPSLINRYFGGKAALYAAVLTEKLPTDPLTAEVGTGELARAIVRRHLKVADGMDEPTRRARIGLLTRSIDPGEAGTVTRLVTDEIVQEYVGQVTGPDAEVRRALLLGQLVGVTILRDMLRLPALADVPTEKIVWYLAPAVHQLLAGRAFPDTRPRPRGGA